MNICFVTAEFAPLAKTGGLADAAAGLARFLAESGHDLRVFVPDYADIDTSGMETHDVDFMRDMRLDMGGRAIAMSGRAVKVPDGEYWVHLLQCPELYDRPGVYRSDGDEHIRFAALARGAIEACQRMGWGPDLFHCHDWHAALLPVYLKTVYAWDDLVRNAHTLLTIHNLGFQGEFGSDVLGALSLEAHASVLPQEDLDRGRLNFLRAGLVHAGVITTVSRSYACEIQTEAFGMGMDGLLRHRRRDLLGIINGVDYRRWSPEHDTLIPHPYTKATRHEKRRNTDALLARLGLEGLQPAAARVPTIGLVSRLTGQKGHELLFEPLPRLLDERDVRVVVLGTGEDRFVEFFESLQRRHPGRMCFYHGYSEDLAHLIEAGADMFLMPSSFEPCGLNQMYSLRYGTIPIVRKVGGLADTVEPWNATDRTGTGFVFEHYTPEGVTWALNEALETFADPTAWDTLMSNGMEVDFSWERQGREYLAAYERASRREAT